MSGITATRTFNPGDIVHTEEPFAQVVSKGLKDDLCEYCCEGSENLKACKKCLLVKYCGKDCQKKDSSDHRLVCNHLKNLPACDYQELVHLIGKVTLKIKNADWKTVKSRILGREVSFDDLNSHLEELTENPRVVLRYKELKENVRKFIGDKNMPDEDIFIKIMGKTLFNVFSKGSTTRHSVLSFFIGVSLIQHECIPNCNKGVSKRNLEFWAMKKIKETAEISASLKNVLSTEFENILGIYEICKCSNCSLPYGDTMLTRMTDEKKAFSVITATKHFLFMSQYFSNIYMIPNVERRVDDLLKQQGGVLASTNDLRLKLLDIKCFQIESNPIQRVKYLMELEENVSTVFGEHYFGLVRIYEALTEVNKELGNLAAIDLYRQKGRDILQRMN